MQLRDTRHLASIKMSMLFGPSNCPRDGCRADVSSSKLEKSWPENITLGCPPCWTDMPYVAATFPHFSQVHILLESLPKIALLHQSKMTKARVLQLTCLLPQKNSTETIAHDHVRLTKCLHTAGQQKGVHITLS